MTTIERRTHRSPRELVRVVTPLVLVWTVGVAVLAAVAGQGADRSAALLMDPTFLVGAHWYTGLVSNLGILGWTVALAAAAAGAWASNIGGRRKASVFLRWGAVVCALLLVDDLFQLHAIVADTYLRIPKSVATTAIALCGAWWVLSQRSEIRRTHVHLLVAALVGLAASLVVDHVIDPIPGDGWLIAEDGAKFLGILAWATYFVVTAADISRSVLRQALLTWPDEAFDAAFGDAPGDLAPTEHADPAESGSPLGKGQGAAPAFSGGRPAD